MTAYPIHERACIEFNYWDRWLHLGHTGGDFLYMPQHSLGYVAIPKNASSGVWSMCEDHGWQGRSVYDQHQHDPHTRFFVILRDPVERWCSGMAEFANLRTKDSVELFDNTSFIDWLLASPSLDDHTDVQVSFLNKLDVNQVSAIWMNQNLAQNISDWCDSFGYSNHFDKLDIEYSADESPTKKHIKNTLKKIVYDNPNYLNKLKEWFTPDYYLFEQLTERKRWWNEPSY